ncbi:MAG: hypothetical protein PVJ21_18400 [Anaerolineales bacterium]|jgi:hypothetical protein
MRKIGFVLAVLNFFLLSCLGLAVPTQDVDEIVQATIQALTDQAPELTSPTEASQPGSISGRLGYPSEVIPALRVVAFDTNSDNFYYVETIYNQTTYQISDLPVGSYHVVAYTLGGGSFPAGLAGGYTQAVPCGQTQECSDHSLIPVEVSPGQDIPDIDPIDWVFEENSFPPMPGPASSEGTGSVTGSLSYPSEFIPPLRVFAFQVGSENYFYVDTAENQITYQIDNLPTGYYKVVAYRMDGKLAGGYTQAVPCGLSVECNNHDLLDVPVNIGQVVNDIDPADWYAPDGAFPPPPVLP